MLVLIEFSTSCCYSCYFILYVTDLARLISLSILIFFTLPAKSVCVSSYIYILTHISVFNWVSRNSNKSVIVFYSKFTSLCFFIRNLKSFLTCSWRRFLSYKNQRKAMDRFLYDRELRHERLNALLRWVKMMETKPNLLNANPIK